MRILISAANGKTGRHVVDALRCLPLPATIRGLDINEGSAVDEPMVGDMCDPRVLARAVEGVDTVVHYGPPMHPREAAMGMAMIDAAGFARVKRFVFISVVHPEIDDLVNHKAKLAIEGHLINSRLDWTVLRPQHYMQNIDVLRVIKEGRLVMPYPVTTVLGHVDMADLAMAAAKVVTEPGHSYATYDISADEPLSVSDICSRIGTIAGQPIRAMAIDPYAMVEVIKGHWHGPLSDYSIDAFHRLFGYYARHGIQGNSNVLTWLLGRPPGSFDDYVRRSLAGRAGKVGNAG